MFFVNMWLSYIALASNNDSDASGDPQRPY